MAGQFGHQRLLQAWLLKPRDDAPGTVEAVLVGAVDRCVRRAGIEVEVERRIGAAQRRARGELGGDRRVVLEASRGRPAPPSPPRSAPTMPAMRLWPSGIPAAPWAGSAPTDRPPAGSAIVVAALQLVLLDQDHVGGRVAENALEFQDLRREDRHIHLIDQSWNSVEDGLEQLSVSSTLARTSVMIRSRTRVSTIRWFRPGRARAAPRRPSGERIAAKPLAVAAWIGRSGRQAAGSLSSAMPTAVRPQSPAAGSGAGISRAVRGRRSRAAP